MEKRQADVIHEFAGNNVRGIIIGGDTQDLRCCTCHYGHKCRICGDKLCVHPHGAAIAFQNPYILKENRDRKEPQCDNWKPDDPIVFSIGDRR